MSQNLSRSSSFGPDMGRRIIKQVRQLRSISFRRSGSESVQAPASPPAMRDLREFLTEAELNEYYTPLLTRLKVSTVEHLKYVKEEDLEDIGMTRPEMRRLKKFYRKECPQGAINKLRKAILRGGGDGTSRTLSPSPPAQRGPRPVSTGAPFIRPPGKQLIPVDSVQLNKTLGEGEFGVVQQAVWTTETGEKLQVAAKRLRRERMNTGTQNFLKEAGVLQELDHDHIVRVWGVVVDTDDNVMLVTELAPMRSLFECLKDPTLRVDLPIPRLCDYAQQVADGMSYLESKQIVHRDLAARNILVFSKNLVKISDLALSKLLGAGQDYYQSKFSVSLKLPIAWCAPECINYLKFTSASDVWSFGVMLWEFFTYGFQPWAGMNGQQIMEAIDEPHFQRLEQPDLCTNEIYKLMRECWAAKPEQRPSFSDILLRLPQLRPIQVKALKDYPSPTVDKGYVYYKAGDVLVVIDKSPPSSSPPGLVWRGVLANGKSGLFDPTNVVPFIEPKISPVSAKTASLARKESNRKSGRKIRADMISHPQNDLRHTGHIGYDGAVFGDVSFIGDNYDKLPVKVEAGMGASRGSSLISLPHGQDSPDRNGHVRPSNSQDSLDRSKNGYGQSWISQESLNSQSTYQSQDGRYSPNYLDVEDDSLFSDFKMPDLGSSFDFGPSFMDEVLKALNEKEKQVTSSAETTPTGNLSSSLESDLKDSSAKVAPTPAPRETRTSSSSAPPLPSQPPRAEPQKEKKQAKVKPMSASDERMVDTAMARARELTSHMIGGSTHSPPVSPSQEEKTSFFDDDSGIFSKLKNSIKRNGSPKGERKRTFSEELEHKGDMDDEVSPEAQQAYNLLVVKGSFKEKSASSSQHSDSRSSGSKELLVSQKSRSRASSKSSQEFEQNTWSEPDLIRDSRHGSSPPKISAPVVISVPHHPTISAGSTPSPPVPSTRPVISAPLPQGRPVVAPKSAPPPAPVPAPRPRSDSTKKSEIPVPRPRPEIQRVEPTIRQTIPASPDIPPKSEKRIDSHIPVPASKERDREELKKTIEIVRIDDSGSLRDDVSERASTSFDRSSARSSQRSSLDRSDNTSENAESERADWEHSECSSDGSRPGRDSEFKANSFHTSVERKDSFTKKQTSSLFEEDLSEPSPQEIMSKLRERRLNRHLDHQRALGGEGEAASVVTTRPRPSAREPQGIPGRTHSIDTEDGGDGGDDEVDTNPLRMLRGGAIPIRTAGRGAAGTSSQGNRGAAALRVPRLNFSSPLSRSIPVHQKAGLSPQEGSTEDIQSTNSDFSLTAGDHNLPPDTTDCAAAAELTREVEKLTNTLMRGDLSQVAHAVVADSGNHLSPTAVEELKKFSSSGLQMDLSLPLQSGTTSTKLSHSANIDSPKQPTAMSDSICMDKEKSSAEVSQQSLAPPRLPPRRSHSVSENPETPEVVGTQLSRSLRRSSSMEDSDTSAAPALPPRDPQPGRTPLNSRPRERKYPLLVRPSSQESPTRPQQPLSPRHDTPRTPTPTMPHTNVKQPVQTITSPTTVLPSPQQPPTTAALSRQHAVIHTHPHTSDTGRHSPQSPTHRHPSLHTSHMTRSLDSTNSKQSRQPMQQSRSVELPPAYDLSATQSHSSTTVADSEPTHMLLDPHSPHLPFALHVNFPTTDQTIDEPTHVSLSSLTDNKYSWSSTFTSPSPLSPSFRHGHPAPSNTSQSRNQKSFHRSLSHTIGQNRDRKAQVPNLLYPEFTDNQSPPADLPPAPPTPSYREKLGLDSQRPKITRSISHTPHTGRSTPQTDPHLLSVDLSASTPAAFRGRSASATSPAHHRYPIHASVTSPNRTTTQHIFRYPQHTSKDDDDNAFFAEAPSVPHPYSQSPFHPIITTSTQNSSPQSPTVYSSVSIQQSPTHISPYQVSSSVTSSHQQHTSSVLGTSSLSTHPSEAAPPPISPRTSSRRIVDNYVIPSHSHSSHSNMQFMNGPTSRMTTTQLNNPSSTPSSPPPPLSPRTSSKNAVENYRLSAASHKAESGAMRSGASDRQMKPSAISSVPAVAQANTESLVFKFPNLQRPTVQTSQESSTLHTTAAAAAQSNLDHYPGGISSHDASPTSSEVSPLMFASYSNAASVSYEDLRQFALDRQKNCKEIETLLKIFPHEVTVEECMTALEGTQWDVSKATKYLQLKKLLSLGVADVHKCKEALTTCGWDLQRAADMLLESARASTVSTSSSSLSSSSRGSPGRSEGGIGNTPQTSRNRPPSPEIVDV